MAEIRTVTTLTRKRALIIRTIDMYEKNLAKARCDLAHVNAIIRLFQASDPVAVMPAYADIHRLYRYAEIGNLCLEALKDGPKSTQQLGRHLAQAKGFDVNDKTLIKMLTYRAVTSMRSMELRGKVKDAGRIKAPGHGGIRLWKLPAS